MKERRGDGQELRRREGGRGGEREVEGCVRVEVGSFLVVVQRRAC